ncbi:MAG: LamG domain-containing protein, partial [Bacteroidaceae bacterium]
DCPIYNDEVGAWYFEIYVKQAGKPETLVTTTTSWAAYVVDAPLSNPNDLSYQIGVRAVSPNGKTGSEIVWSKTLSNDVITPIETLTINKSIIKPNEEFVFGFEDPTHVVADFEILNSRTGAKVFSKNGVQKITLSLPDVDCYDVKVTYGGKTTITRGLIQITPIETGALPKINTMVADKTQVNTGEATNLTYTADKGEGTVSQSLYIADPLAIKVDKSVHTGYPFTYALWFKADKFSHATKGTVLLQKLNKNDTHSWTESAWGEVLVAIRSEMMSESKPQQANEVSLSTFGGIAGSSYPHGSIVDHAITSGYSVTPESWTHLAVTMDQNKKQCIYINGRKVCETTSSWKSILADTYLYIGGSTNDLAGFTGWIDELQVWNKALSEAEVADCMTGYAQAPSGLTSYFKFEDESGSEFINEGTAAASVGTATVIKWKEENKVMVDELQTPKRDLGVPSIEGIRNITFESAKWTLPGVTSQSGTDAVSATYQADGKYNVTLKLTNSWGTTEKTLTEYIVVGTGISGIENGSVVEDLTIYPNPFVESANIMFAAEGKYVVDVYNDAALKIASKSYHATAGEVCNLSFESEQGLYFVRVMRDGKCIKTFKITKDL